MIDKIVCCHGIPLSIISDRGAQFTSRFLRLFPEGIGTKVKLSTTFYPQMADQVKRTIKTLQGILSALMIDFKGYWDRHLPMVEFTYNNSFHSSISMAPYEALYGRRCMSPIGWFEAGESYILGPKFIYYFGESSYHKKLLANDL